MIVSKRFYMLFFLSIKIKQIKYSGQNLGRNFRIALKFGDQIADFRFELLSGKAKSFDKVIFQKALDGKSINLPARIEITELDPVYNDLGSDSTRIKIKLKDGMSKREIWNVGLEGKGRDKNKKAVLTFIFEVSPSLAIRYISDVDPNGWLKVKFSDNSIHSLPHWLKVEMRKVAAEREYFKILEGNFRGFIASVSLKEHGKSYLLNKGSQLGPARLIFNQTEEKLTIIGLRTYRAIVQHDPIPPGKYDLEIPAEPHAGGTTYLKYSKYAKTWFRISHSGKRFLHVGSRSAGCITVTEKNKWTEIYNLLIRSRKNSISVGEVLVE